MSIASVLQDTKARLDGLLEYANETTGQSDVSIGDAIKTLADGFGGGGNMWEKIADITTTEEKNQILVTLANPKAFKRLSFKVVCASATANDSNSSAYFVFTNSTNASSIKWEKHGRFQNAFVNSQRIHEGVVDITPYGSNGYIVSQGSAAQFPSTSTTLYPIANDTVTEDTIIKTVGIQSQDGADKKFGIGTRLIVYGK